MADKWACKKKASEKKMEKQVQMKDSFLTGCEEYDLILKVQDRNIYVSKAVLCVASPVFKAMLKSDFKEKDQQEVELPGKKYDNFVEFLCCFYPDKLKQVTDGNVYRILPYVVEYQITVLQERCQNLSRGLVLQKHSADAKEIYRHLQLAEKYFFESLKNDCIYLASELSLTKMDEGSTAYAVSVNSVLKIRYLALKRKELDQNDDMGIFDSKPIRNLEMYEIGVSVRDIVSDKMNVYNVYKGSSSRDRLRAARLRLRLFEVNYEEISQITSFLKAFTPEELKYVQDELDLLPVRVKQSLFFKYQEQKVELNKLVSVLF